MRRKTLRLLVALTMALAVLVPFAPSAGADVTNDTAAAVQFASSQGYRSAVGVLDMTTGQFWGAGDTEAAFASESLIKLFIAARLLVEGQMSDSWVESTAYKMVTQSDDASANALYGRVGGDGLINWVKSTYNLPDLGTPPMYSGNWGGTNLTAHGYATFYNAIDHDGRVWPWVQNAIHNATQYGSDGQYQYFGIPAATSDFGIKQGWGNDDYPNQYPEFNSTGSVNGDRFAVVILTQGGVYGQPIMDVLSGEAQRIMPGGTINVGGRIGVTRSTDGEAFVKEGSLSATWADENSGVKKIVLAGSRIGVLKNDGTVYVKDGSLSDTWVAEADHAADLALGGTRIGVVTGTGDVLVKEGPLSATWTPVTSGGVQVALTPTRIAVLHGDGTAYVKDGAITASWAFEADNGTQLVVDGVRIGVVQRTGMFYAKEGDLFAGWSLEADRVSQAALAGARIGVLRSDGTTYVKEGSLTAGWLGESTGTTRLALSPQRIGIVTGDGKAWVKEGSLSATWSFEADTASTIALS